MLSRIYVLPALALALGLPLLVAATVSSVGLIGSPFPGFLLMADAVVTSVSGYDWPSDRGALFHSQIVALDGVPVRSGTAIYARARTLPPGSPVTYTFTKDGTTFQRTLPTRTFTVLDFVQVYAVLLAIGALSLGVGVVVGFLQPTTAPARAYLLLSFVGCIYTTTAIFLHRTEPAWLTVVYFAAECLFPATLIHLALVFPTPLTRQVRRQRSVIFAPYLLSAVLTITVLAGMSRHPASLAPLHLVYLFTGLRIARIKHQVDVTPEYQTSPAPGRCARISVSHRMRGGQRACQTHSAEICEDNGRPRLMPGAPEPGQLTQ